MSNIGLNLCIPSGREGWLVREVIFRHGQPLMVLDTGTLFVKASYNTSVRTWPEKIV